MVPTYIFYGLGSFNLPQIDITHSHRCSKKIQTIANSRPNVKKKFPNLTSEFNSEIILQNVFFCLLL